jgi:hypothetical protein
LAVALERARLWERVEGGFQIHDWAEYQPSAYETKSRRESVSKVRSAASALAHHRRWHEARGVRSDECPHCEPDAKSMPNRCQIDAPVPVPVPITSSLSTTTTARESAAPSSSSSSIDDPRFGETVDLPVRCARRGRGGLRCGARSWPSTGRRSWRIWLRDPVRQRAKPCGWCWDGPSSTWLGPGRRGAWDDRR